MNNCQGSARPKYIPGKLDLQFCRISQCLFAVLCQIVCLNLVYFTFLVLVVLSAEIFISLPLRSCAFPLFCEKMCWPALCVWVIVFILITCVPVEGDWVLWPLLSLTISCLAFLNSLSSTKFLCWSPAMSLETIWSWHLHAKSSRLKVGVGIIKVNKHTLLPNAEIPLSRPDSRHWGKKKPKHILDVVQILILKTSLPHKHAHIFLIAYSILLSTHALRTSFIHSFNTLIQYSWYAKQWARQASLCPHRVHSLTWKADSSVVIAIMGVREGTPQEGICMVSGSHGNYARGSDTQVEEREEWVEETSTRED